MKTKKPQRRTLKDAPVGRCRRCGQTVTAGDLVHRLHSAQQQRGEVDVRNADVTDREALAEVAKARLPEVNDA